MLLHSPLLDRTGERLGRVEDVIVRLADGGYPPVTGLKARIGGRELFVPIDKVASLEAGAARLAGQKLNLGKFERREGEVLLRADVVGDPALFGPAAAGLVRSDALVRLRVSSTAPVGLLALVEDQIVDCFRHGGGLPYSAFPKFQAVMAEDSGAVHDATLIDVTLPLVPGLVDKLRQGIDVADVGCGSGHAANLMAEAFPRSRFVGFDFSDTGIAAARAEADRKDLANARFEKRDAAHLGEIARFDFITTFDAVHDQARPDLMLAGIAQALRPDGVYLCVDTSASSKLAENVEHPLGPFLYTVSCMHCMTVSLAEGGMGLGTMWGEDTARKMLSDAGFASIEAVHIDGDIVNAYIIATKG